MDAYHDQRRFAGSGDAPPPPPAPQPPHPNAQWYPPPPPYHQPHPGHPYPPQHHQWGPPPPGLQHHQQPPPYGYQPPPQQQHQQPYGYPPPAPGPGNAWPPHHAAGQPPPSSYPPPPPGQVWPNHSWAQNHGYPGHGNEEDWATKAKAWASAQSVPENHQVEQHAISTSRTENEHYGYHDQYQQLACQPTEVTEPLHPPAHQSSNDHVPFQMTGQQRETNHLLDRGPMASPAKNFGSFPSTYEQEVSYNYSSAPGNGNAMFQYPSSQGQLFPTALSVQDGFPRAPPTMHVVPSMEQAPFGHGRQSVDLSDQPLEFDSRKAPDMAVHTAINFNSAFPAAPTAASDHDVVATSIGPWMPSATMDPSVHAAPLFGAISGSNYVPAAAFGVGTVTEAFPRDPTTPFSVAEKSKKPPVPNWLREELLKKKSAPLSSSTQHLTNVDSMESNEIEQPLRRPDQSDSRSNDSARSTEDDDDEEDEIEAARMAAINQEIKRVLTEVLLKVTDDLFYEIATKVLNEDDSSAANEPTGVFPPKVPVPGESKTNASAKVVLPAKPTNISSSDHKEGSGLSSPKGALLGLASYDSDDDDDDGDGEDKISRSNLPAETDSGTANAEEGYKSTIKLHVNHDEKNSSLGSSSSGEDLKSVHQKNQRGTNAEPEHEHAENGEVPSDTKTFIQPKGTVHKTDEKAHGYADVDIRNSKASSANHAERYNGVESSPRHVKKRSEEDFVKANHAKELDSSTSEKYRSDDKYSKHGNADRKGSSDRIRKHESDAMETHSRGNSKHDDAKADRKTVPKDTRERNRDTTERRGVGRGKDEKEDISRQMRKNSRSHSDRRSRSRSPRGRSQTRKESTSHVRGSVSSDEPSDSVKRRKLHSRKNSISPSPPKSRNRRVSRSPHSKHSHRRHSPYSSAERRRGSRSRTPVKRR